MKHQNIRWTQRADSFRKAFLRLKEASGTGTATRTFRP